MNHQKSKEQASTTDSQSAGAIEGIEALDPTLLEAAEAGHPWAFDALAGVLENSLLASILGGVSGGQQEQAAPPDPAPAEASDAEPAGAGGPEGEVTAMGAGGEVEEDDGRPRDGSGEHARLPPNVADYANHAFWQSVALGAQGMGMPNASRHMDHFLKNSGATLTVDVAEILQASSAQQRAFEHARMQLLNQAVDWLWDADRTKPGKGVVHTPRSNDAYIGRGDSQDWFFAIGGNTTWMDGEVDYLPDPDGSGWGWLKFHLTWHLFDKYNWDEGKTTNIGGIEVSDEVLGRLHVVGLAQEYQVEGEMDAPFVFRTVPEDTSGFHNELPEVVPPDGAVEPGREPPKA